ncbi:nudix hydrolase 9 isoform X2 [Lycium barbarum]|uniref:nudix hydrolase 9 isoform X2 n=1 Tax=Lycium barbarum TaxID=112863 RepID=UPI00293EF2EA|nr:nudix hydrolase 9 isoform X2 [Lycium barbarum]
MVKNLSCCSHVLLVYLLHRCQLFLTKHMIGFHILILLWSTPFPRFTCQTLDRVSTTCQEKSLHRENNGPGSMNMTFFGVSLPAVSSLVWFSSLTLSSSSSSSSSSSLLEESEYLKRVFLFTDMGCKSSTKFITFQWNKVQGNDPKQQSHVSLHLGLTDYRTFVGTNLSSMWERFLVSSEDDCIQCQHTSSPLGNGAVVETSDRRILVLQRSNKVGEFPGYFVFPGGHPEPQEVGIMSHEGLHELNQCQMINSKVSQEMFDSIVREVVEEVGAPADTLSSPIFIGLSRRVLNVRPTAFFFIKCNLPSDEIQQLYSSAQDGFESTQLYAVSMSDLEDMTSKMPGCHRGGFALYKLMVQHTSDS